LEVATVSLDKVRALRFASREFLNTKEAELLLDWKELVFSHLAEKFPHFGSSELRVLMCRRAGKRFFVSSAPENLCSSGTGGACNFGQFGPRLFLGGFPGVGFA
jgi:hypothetical protein